MDGAQDGRVTDDAATPEPAPDEDDELLDPEEAERRISTFIADADALPGLPVARLADDVAAVMDRAWREIEAMMFGVPKNKLIATMLLVSQWARTTDAHDRQHWQLHAASTLVSGMIPS